jgi:hypothetical protein
VVPYSKCEWSLSGAQGIRGQQLKETAPARGKLRPFLGACRGRPGTNVQSCRPIARSFTIQTLTRFKSAGDYFGQYIRSPVRVTTSEISCRAMADGRRI